MGEVAGRPLGVLIAADDKDAKDLDSLLALDGGLRPVDAGPLARARELEAAGLLHIGLQGVLGSGYASALQEIASSPGARPEPRRL